MARGPLLLGGGITLQKAPLHDPSELRRPDKAYRQGLRRQEAGRFEEGDIQTFYDGWTACGKFTMAHGLVTMLRGLINFGRATLEDGECERLSVVLHNMNFPRVKSRSARLTAEHAIAVRKMAWEMGRPSMPKHSSSI